MLKFIKVKYRESALFNKWMGHKRISRNLLGLDISGDSIKLVEISQAREPYKIINIAKAPIPEGVIHKDEIKDTQALSSVISELIFRENIKTKHVVIAVPRSVVTIKKVFIDTDFTESEIESRAWIEAGQQYPELVGGIYLDYQLGLKQDESSKQELTIVACRKDHLDPYLRILTNSDLIPYAVDVNSYALKRAMSLVSFQDDMPSRVALLNLDLSLSSFIVLQDDNLLYGHDHSYDGHRLIDKANEYLKNHQASGSSESIVSMNIQPASKVDNEPNLTSSTVEKVSQGPISQSESQVKLRTVEDPEYLEIIRENLIAQLRHSMHFFYSGNPNYDIQKLVLSGDCVTLPKLALFVEQEMGIKTIIANPLAEMNYDKSVDPKMINDSSAAMMVSSGLSIRDEGQLNLLPWREQLRKVRTTQFTTVLVTSLIFAISLAVLTHFYFASLLEDQNGRNQYVQGVIKEEQLALKELEKKKESEVKLREKLYNLVGLQLSSNNAVSMLDELAKIVPGTISLISINYTADEIVINGVSQSDLDITLFMQKLADSAVFATPTLDEIKTSKTSTNGEKSFTLKVKQSLISNKEEKNA